MKDVDEKITSYKGSFTVEAAIYLPIILFMLIQTVKISIDYLQESRERKVNMMIQDIDVVSEFYGYQIIDDIGKEIMDDQS